MPEGHTVHRLAAALGELYGGQRLEVFSPQGRFAHGASRLDGLVLLGAQAHGKHLFVAFGPEPGLPADLPAGTLGGPGSTGSRAPTGASSSPDAHLGTRAVSDPAGDPDGLGTSGGSGSPDTSSDASADSASAVTWLRIHLGLYGSWTFDGDAEFTAPHAIGAPRRRVGERGEHALRGGGGSALSGLGGGEASGADGTRSAEEETGSAEAAGAAPASGRAPGQWVPPEPRGMVRLRLLGEHGVADLTGPAACELLDAQGVAAVRRRLGPDPLRREGSAGCAGGAAGSDSSGNGGCDSGGDNGCDGGVGEFVRRVRSRRRAVGELLMDQSVIAGAGNIYRAETLFRVGVSPFVPGNQVSQDRLRRIWADLTPLMEYGVATGFITTVEDDDVPRPLPEGDPEAGRWYVYHRTGRPCLRCSTPVREQTAAGRRLFWCPACQAG